MDIHGYHGHPLPPLDRYGYEYGRYPNGYPKWTFIWISMSIVDIQHGYPFWICMDVDMVDIRKDIQNTYPCWISMSFWDIQHGYIMSGYP